MRSNAHTQTSTHVRPCPASSANTVACSSDNPATCWAASASIRSTSGTMPSWRRPTFASGKPTGESAAAHSFSRSSTELATSLSRGASLKRPPLPFISLYKDTASSSREGALLSHPASGHDPHPSRPPPCHCSVALAFPSSLPILSLIFQIASFARLGCSEQPVRPRLAGHACPSPSPACSFGFVILSSSPILCLPCKPASHMLLGILLVSHCFYLQFDW